MLVASKPVLVEQRTCHSLEVIIATLTLDLHLTGVTCVHRKVIVNRSTDIRYLVFYVRRL